MQLIELRPHLDALVAHEPETEPDPWLSVAIEEVRETNDIKAIDTTCTAVIGNTKFRVSFLVQIWENWLPHIMCAVQDIAKQRTIFIETPEVVSDDLIWVSTWEPIITQEERVRTITLYRATVKKIMEWRPPTQ